MGNFLGSGYAIWVPTFTLDGTVKVFQTVHMVKPDVPSTPGAVNSAMRGGWCNVSRPYAASQMFAGFTLAKTDTYVNTGGVVTYELDETPVIGTKVGSLGTPINTSILGKKNTGIVGKRYRGRHMWPNMWIAEADISQAGIVSPTPLATAQGLFTAAVTAQIASGYPMVLGHSSSEVTPTPFSSISLQPKIGTMRKRIRGF